MVQVQLNAWKLDPNKEPFWVVVICKNRQSLFCFKLIVNNLKPDNYVFIWLNYKKINK